jgi:hypothetical protein
MDQSRPFVIISASKVHNSWEVNSGLSSQLFQQLADRGFRPRWVSGRYRGVHESAFIVSLPGNGQAGHVMSELAKLGKRYGQETVLYVDSNRIASLHSPANGWSLTHVEELGPWRELDRYAAFTKEAYTVIDGRYFVAGNPKEITGPQIDPPAPSYAVPPCRVTFECDI